MSHRKTLWTIREGENMPAALWRAFIEKARAAGSTPAAVLHALITRYVEGAPRHDHTD